MFARVSLIALGVAALAALSAGVISSCAAAGPAVVTAMAGGAALESRREGGCYSMCVAGTRCNPNNGLCEKYDCHCGDGFTCVETETGTACVVADHQAELAARPQEPVVGSQPFGDGQQASTPLQPMAVTGGAAGGTPGGGEPDGPSSITAHKSPDAGVSRGQPLDGGSAVPASALKTAPVKVPDGQPNNPQQPWLDMTNNPWDPHHADPSPQMANPNQPPPH